MTSTIDSLKQVLDHFGPDESKHYNENGRPEDHIHLHIDNARHVIDDYASLKALAERMARIIEKEGLEMEIEALWGAYPHLIDWESITA